MSQSAIERAFPLTPLQEGMLYHGIREPDSTAYRGWLFVELEGELDRERFRRAWSLAAERHEALRSRIVWERRDRPLQVVMRELRADLQFADWSGHEDGEAEAAWRDLLGELGGADGSSGAAMSMRLRVVSFDARRHRLAWTMHHAFLDGWSVQVVLKELLEDYAALAEGGAVKRPDPPSFSRYVGWLEGRADPEDGTFWRRHLAGVEAATPPPASEQDRSGPWRETSELRLGSEASAALRAAGAAYRVTLNTMCVAAWGLLLARYHQQRTVLFGTTATDRPAEIEGVQTATGLYLSTVPVVLRVPGNEGLGPWLRRVQLDLSEARDRGGCGLPVIQSWSDLPRGAPLFESLVVFESFPKEHTGMPEGGALVPREVSVRGPSEVPASLLVHPDADLRLELEHDPECIPPAEAGRILADMRTILVHLARGDADLATVVGTRRGQVVTGPGNSGVTVPVEVECPDVIERFEEQVRVSPDRLAIAAFGTRWTYRELDQRSEGIARRLLALPRPASRVGVAASRTPGAIAAMIGALKAGLAYVPLDPEAPPERLRKVVSSIDAAVGDVLESAVGGSIPVLGLDHPAPAASGDGDAPLPAPDPDGVAYVIHTSGSTGDPKGVEVLRRNLAWSTGARFQHYGIPADTFLLMSPLTVDSSVAGIYWTLAAGGTLVLPADRIEQDTRALADLICAEGVTHTLLLPSLWDALLDDLDSEAGASLQTVIVAGEPCRDEVVTRHRDLLPWVELHNEYGPSEGTVWATVDHLTGLEVDAVTIGRPAPGCHIRVVLPGGTDAPDGDIGEIWIGGPGVAAGYHGDEERSQAAFLTDPQGMRWYRTGDRGRWRSDGRLEFLGRLDDQIKVRGFRVEPGEVEAALAAHPAVAEAGVTLDGPGRLVAHIVSRGEAPSPDSLDAFLTQRLPAHMIPGRYLATPQLPRSPAGKLDRRALAGRQGTPLSRAQVAGSRRPRTGTERTLAEIWCAVLGLDEVGIDDDFFEIGGDSLTSIRAISRANRAGIELTPERFYETPMISALAGSTGGGRTAPGAGSVDGVAPLLPIQRWLFETIDLEHHHWNQAVVVHFRSAVDPDRIGQAVQRLVDRHDALRSRFDLDGEEPSQIIDPPGLPAPFRVVDLSGTMEDERDGPISQEADREHAAASVRTGGLFRAVVFERAGDPPSLLLVAHHLVVDAVSWAIIFDDLAELVVDPEATLAPRTRPVLEWAVEVRDEAATPGVEATLPTWAELRRARDGELMQRTTSGVAELHRLVVEGDPLGSAADVEHRLLAGILLAWVEWRDCSTLRIDVEGHGRDLLGWGVNLSGTVGWFTRLVPYDLKLADPSPAGALRTVREAVRSLRGQERGYTLLRYAHPDPDIRARADVPSGDLLFNYLGETRPLPADAPFDVHFGPWGRERSADAPRGWPLELNARRHGGVLEVTIEFAPIQYSRESIATFADAVERGISRVAESSPSMDRVGGITPDALAQVADLLSKADDR